MCIRDRRNPDPDAFKIVRSPSFETGVVEAEVQIGDATTVSYTHLDVYKRQFSYWIELVVTEIREANFLKFSGSLEE